jgi:hypothetical protein
VPIDRFDQIADAERILDAFRHRACESCEAAC